MSRSLIPNERGIALITVLLVTLVVGVISVGAALISTNASLINRYTDRMSVLEAVADAGIAEGRSRVNGDAALYPDNSYTILESGVSVQDASGATIPHVRRSLYVGPTGITSGQYGVFGSLVVVAEDDFGNRLIRRGEIVQESFAKYAYFTDNEGGNIWFGGGDQLFGPVHSNDRIQIHPTGVTFWSTVETARYMYQPHYGTFHEGYTEYGPYIPMPQTADLVKLRTQAQAGNTYFVGNISGGFGETTTRIEFMALDLNGDGDSTDANEGFIRVYQQLADAYWVSGDRPNAGWNRYSSYGLTRSEHCGYWNVQGNFVTGAEMYQDSGYGNSTRRNKLTSATRRCYLGGSDTLSMGFVAGPDAKGGRWLQWPGAVSPLLAARADAAYLFPISRQLNPSFKGVIFVDGKVGISGKLRGRVTIAAMDDIVILDDIIYATDPGAGTCADILGIFSGNAVVVADNTINAPSRPWPSWSYRPYDDTLGEFIQGVVLALGSFTVENYNSGSSNAEPCQGTPQGRGCLYLTGGIIQDTRGAVGLLSGRGYTKRYSYDQCAFTNPPPYFPTTGHFARGRYYEVDPVAFDVAAFYRLLSAN
ncbi:MAG: hypothetical protein IH965_13690 [Gemmatimonadetes bacterium]|nr:hypothetical protein [Gemmatimonadota bacterium]